MSEERIQPADGGRSRALEQPRCGHITWKSEGNTQLAQYRQGLENWCAKDKAALFSAYPNVKQCERDGRLELRTELVTYSFCPSSADELGERLEPIAPDVSSEGD